MHCPLFWADDHENYPEYHGVEKRHSYGRSTVMMQVHNTSSGLHYQTSTEDKGQFLIENDHEDQRQYFKQNHTQSIVANVHYASSTAV
jgi:hypothetical protein